MTGPTTSAVLAVLAPLLPRSVERDDGPQPRALPSGDELERAVEHREPVLQAGVQASAAAAVVGDLDHQRVAVAGDADVGDRRLGVLGDVGQRLGDGEVGGGLDRGREALLRDGQLDDDGAPP